jgi:hypothetical protein
MLSNSCAEVESGECGEADPSTAVAAAAVSAAAAATAPEDADAADTEGREAPRAADCEWQRLYAAWSDPRAKADIHTLLLAFDERLGDSGERL